MLRLFGSATMRLMPSSARRILLRFAAATARPRHLRTLLGEVVLQQLLHGRRALTQLTVGQLLRIAHQLARQLIQLLRQRPVSGLRSSPRLLGRRRRIKRASRRRNTG